MDAEDSANPSAALAKFSFKLPTHDFVEGRMADAELQGKVFLVLLLRQARLFVNLNLKIKT